MLKLVISDEEGKTTVVPLQRDEITIGRKEGNTIRLTERNVSRRHARIAKRSGDYLIEDLASYNGVVVNGSRLVDVRPVRHGDQILIGDYKLSILEEATAQMVVPPPAPPPAPGEAPPSVIAAPMPLPPRPAAATPPPSPSAPPGLAALNDPFAAPAATEPTPSTPSPSPTTATPAGGSPVPEAIRGLRLVFLAPAGVPAPIMLDRLPLILGRSEAADVALPFSSISREHARLFVQDGQLAIEDLGSANGVSVNNEKTPRALIGPGDMVQLGVVEFRVARRGDSTVVIQKVAAAEAVAAPRKMGPVIGLVVGVGAVLGLAAFFMFRTPSSNTPPVPANPPITSPSEPGTTPVPTPIPGTPAVAAPTTPPANNVAPPLPPPQVPSTHAPAPSAPANTAAAPPPPVPANPGETPRTPTATRHQPGRTTPAVAAPTPVPTPAVAPRPTPATTARPTTSPTPAAVPAAPSGGSPLESARACSGAERNACIVSALRGRAQTMQELGMLASTYRVMGDRDNAVRTMRQYINRYPAGPLSSTFTNYINASP